MELDHYFYRINQVLLSLCGFWPHQSKGEKIIRRFIFFIIDIGNFPPLPVTIFLTYHQIAYAACNWRDADALIFSIVFIASYALGLTKISNTIIQDKKIQHLFKQITSDWNVWSTKPQVKVLQKFAEQGRSLNFVYTAAVCASASSYTFVTIVPQVYNFFVPRFNITREAYLTPQEFGIDSQKYYYLILAFNVLSVWVNSTIYIIVDTTYLAFVQHTCGLLGAVGDRFENISILYPVQGTKKSKLSMFEEILFCIQQYNSALKFTNLLNDIYSVYFFCIVGISATNLIFAATQTVVNSGQLNEMVKYGQYGLLIVGLLFIISFPAQRLMDHSSNISQNVYNSCWYEMPMSIKKSLLIVLVRASSLCTIKVGKFYVLSMQTFASIVRTTASICMMLLSIR